MDKRALRQRCLAWRRSLTPSSWQNSSTAACERLAQHERVQAARTVLAYVSFRQEIDLSHLWQQFPDKTWGFPRCVGADLVWHRIASHGLGESGEIAERAGTPIWQVGPYGALEPSPHWPTIDPGCVDVVLVPATACDRLGYRLGHGAGYYDRFLPACPAYRIAIAYEACVVEALPVDPWDVPMHAICTESRFLPLRPHLQRARTEG